jgi:hypothetical protein
VNIVIESNFDVMQSEEDSQPRATAEISVLKPFLCLIFCLILLKNLSNLLFE